MPESKYCKNNKSAIAHSDFGSKSIQELLQSGIVVKVDQIPHVVNPLTVSVNAKGKERLILDLRHVNRYVVKYKFKPEGIKEALDFVHKNGFMFKFDLSSGYHHIDLHALMYISILDFLGIIVFMYFLLNLLVYHQHHLFLQRS